MNKLLKPILLATLILASALSASAYSFMVDGIAYNIINGSEASVTYTNELSSSNYNGLSVANIPVTVTFNGVTYNVTSIGSYAFSYCTSLTSVNIPNSVTSIGVFAFEGCSDLTSMIVDNDNTAYDSRDNCNAIIETATNTLIAGCKYSVIPYTVTSIGNGAFSYCTSLTSVNIPNSVTSIGNGAFAGCYSLTSMTVDNDNTAYDSRDNCNAIIETATKTLIAGCKNTVIPNSVTSIGDVAFSYCNGLTSVNIPNSVTSIGNYAFSNCSGLTSINIPNSVTSIGYGVFSNCTRLTSVNIPNSVTFIGYYVFSRCRGLRNLQFNAINCTIGNYTFDDVNLSNLRFGEKVERIPANLPTFSMSGKALVLPNSVRVIDAGALRGSCDAVIIGDSIESIAKVTFPSGISVAYVSSTTPLPCANGAFANPQTLYVPQGCKGKYLMSDGWCEFANIVEGSYIRVTDLTLNVDSATMQIANTLQLNATIMPDDHSATTLEWWSTNESVATVSATGLVTAVAEGDADICCSVDNKTVICHISVVEELVDSIVLNYTDLLLDWDNIVDLTATVYPENVDQNVTWTVPENNNIYARVVGNRLRVMAKRNGTVTVMATSVADPAVSADCVITIQIPDVNGDTSLSIADVTTLINYLLTSDENVIYVEDADVNRDGTITVTDVMALINKLLTH